MLQIGSGKLFRIGTLQVNSLKGIIYTNLHLLNSDQCDAGIGRLTSIRQGEYPHAVIWEFDEHIEGEAREPGVLASNGIRHYINDYATIMSFFLNGVCTTNPALTERLTYIEDTNSQDMPNKLVSRFFDKSIIVKTAEVEELRESAKRLMGLRRQDYRLIMKSIRTYIAAMHRMAEDLDLAYTLMVMSIEVLAQAAIPRPSAWATYASEKRARIDDALNGAEDQIANRVRDAVMQNEHYAIGKRFKEFITQHTSSSYFKAEPSSQKHRIGRRDFESALSHLYGTRSSFVHNLSDLPKEIQIYGKSNETADVGSEIHFTFEGLSRLCRSVIINYLNSLGQIEKEPYDYWDENPNTTRLRLAPEYWAGNPAGLNEERATQYLKGFLLAIDGMYQKGPEGTIIDMRPVILASMKIMQSSKDIYARPYICIAALFYNFVPSSYQEIKPQKKFLRLANDPSVESLCAHIALGIENSWHLEETEKYTQKYFRQREKENGLVVSKKMEACIDLALAESYRRAELWDKLELQIESTKLNHPNIPELHDFLDKFTKDCEIRWLDIIYPMHNVRQQKSTLECNGL